MDTMSAYRISQDEVSHKEMIQSLRWQALSIINDSMIIFLLVEPRALTQIIKTFFLR